MSGAQRILVVEDDAAVRRGLVDALTFESFSVLEAGDGASGRDLALSSECDLVLLDLLLPKGDGLSILRAIRSSRPTLPVIILTARGDESDRVEGLKLGADDYVVKPFGVRELIARIRAVLRRSPARPLDVATVRFPSAGVEVDLQRREVRRAGTASGREELSEKEVDLLRYLARNPGRAISREELIEGVWRLDARGGATRTIDMHVARLREKLGDSGDEPKLLLTVRGKGYMLAGEAHPRGPDAGGGM